MVRIFESKTATFVEVIGFKPHRVIVRETARGERGSTCCTARHAVTVWDLQGPRLVVHTEVLVVPQAASVDRAVRRATVRTTRRDDAPLAFSATMATV